MKHLLVGAALAFAVAAPLRAQQAGQPVTAGHGSFYVGPYAGYMFFGDLYKATSGSGAHYSNEDGGFYGAQAGFSVSPNFSILANLGYSKSKYTLEDIPGSVPTINLSSDIGVWLYDGDLQFRLPFAQKDSWIAPFAQVGAGAIRYTNNYKDFNSKAQTNVAFNGGIGADFQFRKVVGLRILAKDYVTSLKWSNDNTIGTDVVKGQTAHNWGITAGLNFGF